MPGTHIAYAAARRGRGKAGALRRYWIYLRGCYAVSGTDIADAAAMLRSVGAGLGRFCSLGAARYRLRTRCPLSPTHALPAIAYARAVRSPLLTS
eukprot:251028-Rhodomonas_salina.1